jgi:hypothetical protein
MTSPCGLDQNNCQQENDEDDDEDEYAPATMLVFSLPYEPPQPLHGTAELGVRAGDTLFQVIKHPKRQCVS